MNCIKTGARVRFPQYNMTLAADLYKVGNAVVIKANPRGMYDTRSWNSASHEVLLAEQDSFEYTPAQCQHVYVIPADHLVELP